MPTELLAHLTQRLAIARLLMMQHQLYDTMSEVADKIIDLRDQEDGAQQLIDYFAQLDGEMLSEMAEVLALANKAMMHFPGMPGCENCNGGAHDAGRSRWGLS